MTERGAWSTAGLADLIPDPDVALAQHVMPLPAGQVGTHAGAALSAADSMRITVHGRGAHGSMPQAAVDPVVLAAMIVVRLQTVVSREVAPGETAVLTVGSIQAGTKSNVIPDRAVLQLNVRTFSDATRDHGPGRDPPDRARGVRRRPAARGSRSSSCSTGSRSPTTTPRPPSGWRRRSRSSSATGRQPVGPQSASEDFSDIPTALGVPYTYWFIGGIDADTYDAADAGRPGRPGHPGQPLRRASPRFSSRPWTPARRRWSSPRWPGWPPNACRARSRRPARAPGRRRGIGASRSKCDADHPDREAQRRPRRRRRRRAPSTPSSIGDHGGGGADQRRDRVEPAAQHRGDLPDQDVAQRAATHAGDRAEDDRLRRTEPELERLAGAGDGEQAQPGGVQHGDRRVQPLQPRPKTKAIRPPPAATA